MPGEVLAIWVKRARRGPMDPVVRAELVAGQGIRGNADQGKKRQVTIIDQAAWDRMMKATGAALDPSARRANILLRGIELRETRGRILTIGNCRVRIYGETRPCERMDEAFPGLRAAMDPDWNGGVFAEVLDDGEIRVGDRVGIGGEGETGQRTA